MVGVITHSPPPPGNPSIIKMAQIDELVKLVGDERLRRDLEQAVKKLRKDRQFGLVFEEHIPEVLALPDQPLEVGGWALRSGSSKPVQVVSLDRDTAEIRGGGGKSMEKNLYIMKQI